MKLLVVNHHAALGTLVGNLARQTGWTVIQCDRTPDFREIIKKENVELISCDATAAEEAKETVSRLDFIQLLREHNIKTPVFLFEEQGSEVTLDPDLVKKLGGITIFRKPVPISDIRHAINLVADEIKNRETNLKQQRELGL